MTSRVLPRVLVLLLAGLCIAGLSSSASPPACAAERRAHPAATPDDTDDAGARHRHLRFGDDDSPSVSISDEIHVPAGQVHTDDVVCVFGNARIDGEVTGDVIVVMGKLEVSGTVRGSVVAVMSPAKFAETATIEGDLVTVGGPLERAPGSRIDGEKVILNFMEHFPFFHGGLTGILLFFFFVKLALLALLFVAILLITSLVPRRVAVVAEAIPQKWGMAFLAGLIGYCATAILSFILFCTLIGIPLVPLLLFAAKIIKWLGLAAVLFLLGRTLARNTLKREVSDFAAIMGGFAVYAVLSLVPIFGAVFSSVVGILAFGIAILTRFGSEEGWKRTTTLPPPGGTRPPSPGAPPVYASSPGA